MVEIRLHGALAKEYGKVWHLDVASPREAFFAIDANAPGFMNKVMNLDREGMCFRVRTKDHDYDSNDVSMNLGTAKRMDIIPIVMGASAGVRFVVGAALIAASFVLTAYGSPIAGKIAFSAGVSLVLGSVVEWLTKIPKKSENPGGLQSWTINGPTNTVDQGLPVPIIYGEVLTGGYTISAGISTSQTARGQINPADVSIGGQGHITLNVLSKPNPYTVTVVLQLTAGTSGMSEPFSFSWVYTGLAGASAVRLIGANDATVTIEVDVLVTGPGTMANLTGLVSVTATGISPNVSRLEGVGEPPEVTASASRSVSVFVQSVTL